VATILIGCDRVLGEVGRRHHLFAWLRAPDSGLEEWLPVDAYYPGNRLVVLCREQPTEHDHLYAELVPAHGLRLLQLKPSELGDGSAGVQSALERRITALGPSPRRVVKPEPATPASPEQVDEHGEGAVARAVAALAQAPAPAPTQRRPTGPAQAEAVRRAARFVAARKSAVGPNIHPAAHPIVRKPVRERIPQAPAPAPRHRTREPNPRAGGAQAVGIVVGLVLVAVLFVEVLVGVAGFAIAGGHVLLAFGIALDAGARALGTVAAGRAGSPDWTWGCAVGGAPVVAAFALYQRSGPVTIEPAPLAGLISLLSLFFLGAALLGAAIGI
jgi:hypothetical protein